MDDEIVVDGVRVRFVRSGDEPWRVYTLDGDDSDPVLIGTLELISSASGLAASRADGVALTRPSPWGGEVTAHFGSRELAVRALLAGV